jgi:cytochrome P450
MAQPDAAPASSQPAATTPSPFTIRAYENVEPWAAYDALRAQGPLIWDEVMKAWVVLDYASCAYIEINEDKFRNAYVGVPPIIVEVKGGRSNITLTSGDEHKRIRRFLMQLFTPPLLEIYRERNVRPIIAMLIDRFQKRGSADLCAELGDQIPPRVIAALLGLQWQDDDLIARILDLHEKIMVFLGTKFSGEEAAKQALATSHAINDILLPNIRKTRERRGDDFISRIWNEAPHEYGEMDEETVLGICRELFLGGADTTVHGIANALYLMLTNADLRAAISADRKTALAAHVEEAMRLYGSVMYRFRVANFDCEIGGRQVKANQPLILLHSAANRDPAHYGCPHAADLARKPITDHLAFNKGPRACVGVGLARIEMRDTLAAVLDRLPNVRLDPAAEPPQFRSLFMRSWRPLHVLFDV